MKVKLDQQAIKKPFTLSEAGYGYDALLPSGQPGAPTANEVEQARFFTLLTNELVTAQAQGLIVWDAAPQIATIPGSFTKTVDNPYNLITIELFSPPHPHPRKIVVLGADSWNVFYWDFADRPAAPVIRSYFNRRP